MKSIKIYFEIEIENNLFLTLKNLFVTENGADNTSVIYVGKARA
jgi:hypothetical protein